MLIYSCDAGYRICAILSVLGRIGIVSECQVLFTSSPSRPDRHLFLHLSHSFRSLLIAVWGARAYAVFNRSKIVLVIYGALQLIVLGLAAVRVASSFHNVFELFNIIFQ
jgi:hypothetical protein